MGAIPEIAYLSPEEARARLALLNAQLVREQIRSNFQVWDPRPDVNLRNQIEAFVRGLTNTVAGWSDPVGEAVRRVFQSVWDQLFKPAFDAVRGWFDWLLGEIKKYFDPVWEALKGAIEALAERFKPFLEPIWSAVQAAGQWIKAGLSEAWSSFWNWLWGGLQWLAGEISRALQGAWSWIKSGAEWLGGAVWNALTGFWNWLWGGLQWAAGEIAKALQPVWQWIWNGLNWLGEQLRPHVEALWRRLEAFKQWIGEAMKWFWDNVLVPAGQAVRGAFESAVQAVLGAAQGFAHQVVDTILASVPRSPEEVPGILVRALTLGTVAAAAMAAASVLPELAHPLKHIGLPEIFSTVWRAVGWEHTASVIVGAVLGASLGLAAQYWANSVAAMRVPDVGTAAQAVLEEVIDEATFYQWARYQGYSEDKARVILEVADRPPSARDLRRMVYFGLADEKYLEGAIKRSHVERESVPLLVELYKREAEYARKAALRGVYVRLAQEGVISEEELEQALEAAGLTPEEVEVYKKSVAWTVQERLARERARLALQSYRRGLIDEQQLARALKEAGYTDDVIQAYVELYRRQPKEDRQTTPREEVRAIGKDVVVARFVEGVIDEREFEDELRTLGYPETEIQRLKLYARLKRDLNLAKDLLSALREAYRKRRIGDVQFIALARQYGISEEQIRFELSVLKLRWDREVRGGPHRQDNRTPRPG
jgi:hypothetical protein